MKKGFITLLMVIITGFIALGILAMFSMDSIWSVKSSISMKNSGQMRALSNACAEVALETIRENNSWTGTSTVNIGGNTCSYTVSNTGGNNRTILASGTIKNITRKIQITTTGLNPISTSSWQEIQ